jgi:hypothetical protein
MPRRRLERQSIRRASDASQCLGDRVYRGVYTGGG